MLLIFCAFLRELAGLKGRLKTRRPLPDGLTGTMGALGVEATALVATGIGPLRARVEARRALDALPLPRLVITSGVAGALSPDLGPGDLILADSLLLDSSDPAQAPRTIPLDTELVGWAEQRLAERGIKVARGPLLTAGRVLGTAADKSAARQRTGALAVDMESAAVAAAASPAELGRLLCLRAILDTASEELAGAGMTGKDGAVAPLKAAAFLVTHPGALVRIPSLIANLSRATASLARGLEAVCEAPADPSARCAVQPRPPR